MPNQNLRICCGALGDLGDQVPSWIGPMGPTIQVFPCVVACRREALHQNWILCVVRNDVALYWVKVGAVLTGPVLESKTKERKERGAFDMCLE